MYRTERRIPWYHKPFPQCDAVIKRGKHEYQCIFTASYVDTEGRNIFLCKVHSQMVDFPTKPIPVIRRLIRED